VTAECLIYTSNSPFLPLMIHKSKFVHCDLRGVELSGCNIEGLRIDGVLVSELLPGRS